MDEAIERLVDLISVRERVPRDEAELILLNLLGELERLLDRVPPHTLHLTRIVSLDGPDAPGGAPSQPRQRHDRRPG